VGYATRRESGDFKTRESISLAARTTFSKSKISKAVPFRGFVGKLSGDVMANIVSG